MPVDPAMQAYLDAEWNAGRMTRPSTALANLQQNPENFLKRHPLVNTFDCTAHGLTNCYIRNDRTDARRPGSVMGTHNFHSAESFNLEMVGPANAYGHSFPVHGVHMTQSSAGPNWYAMDNTGPAIMLTAKLTGCTFIVRAGATPGSIEATHLQPHQESGLALDQRMQIGGQAAYGRLKYDFAKRVVNVIGVRSGGVWRVWVQKLEKGAGKKPTIRSVHRIWPT